MANLAPKYPFQFARVDGGLDMPINHGIESSTQSYLAGAPLIPSSGSLVESTSQVYSAHLTVGIALAAATGTTGHDVSYVVANMNCVFIGYLQGQSSTHATDGYTLLQTAVGLSYAVAKDAGGNWYLNQGDTTNIGAVVVGLADPIGTVGRVYFKFLLAATPY